MKFERETLELWNLLLDLGEDGYYQRLSPRQIESRLGELRQHSNWGALTPQMQQLAQKVNPSWHPLDWAEWLADFPAPNM